MRGLSEDRFLNGTVLVRQMESGFRSGLDAVMLAAAVPEGDKILELGAGAGVASLCLAKRLSAVSITGLEIDPALVSLATDNAKANDMSSRVIFEEADVFALPASYKRSFDHVLSNPPFHDETGERSADAGRARALQDEGKLSDWLSAGMKRTVSGGTFTTIIRADRVGEALAALPERGILVFPLWPKAGVPAKRVILQARQGARSPLALLPGLVLHERDGRYTPEADAVLRGERGIAL